MAEAKRSGDGVAAAEMRLAMARYYEDARELARRLTEWSKTLEGNRAPFRRLHGRRPGRHGGRQPRRLGGTWP